MTFSTKYGVHEFKLIIYFNVISTDEACYTCEILEMPKIRIFRIIPVVVKTTQLTPRYAPVTIQRHAGNQLTRFDA